ncbi:MAG: hypothetical protein KatS3mg024_2142 [Armatimonadota bacterium]|nr:MAG: hypothetical protein KatS3mg024_2142 [Armatimonadota bacterium]
MPGFWIRALSAASALALSLPAQAVQVRVEELSAPPSAPLLKLQQSLREARASGSVRVYSAGRSLEGRNIPLVVLSPTGRPSLPPVRVLIICAQHGDEPASVEAISDIIRHCASGRDPSELLTPSLRKGYGGLVGLEDVLWVIVPVANPDGLQEGRRSNSAGADINRDWRARIQPETRAVKQAFSRWAPHMVLDLHQWSPDDPPPADNGLEMAAAPGRTNRMERALAGGTLPAVRATGRSVSLISSRPGADPTLAHRYFASAGAVSFLIETAARSAPDERRRMLKDLVLLLSDAAGRTGAPALEQALQGTAAGAAAATFRYPAEYREWVASRSGGDPGVPQHPLSDPRLWAAAAMVLCLVVMRIRPNDSHPQTERTAGAHVSPVRRRPWGFAVSSSMARRFPGYQRARVRASLLKNALR